jgi:hypothetical protein
MYLWAEGIRSSLKPIEARNGLVAASAPFVATSKQITIKYPARVVVVGRLRLSRLRKRTPTLETRAGNSHRFHRPEHGNVPVGRVEKPWFDAARLPRNLMVPLFGCPETGFERLMNQPGALQQRVEPCAEMHRYLERDSYPNPGQKTRTATGTPASVRVPGDANQSLPRHSVFHTHPGAQTQC